MLNVKKTSPKEFNNLVGALLWSQLKNKNNLIALNDKTLKQLVSEIDKNGIDFVIDSLGLKILDTDMTKVNETLYKIEYTPALIEECGYYIQNKLSKPEESLYETCEYIPVVIEENGFYVQDDFLYLIFRNIRDVFLEKANIYTNILSIPVIMIPTLKGILTLTQK